MEETRIQDKIVILEVEHLLQGTQVFHSRIIHSTLTLGMSANTILSRIVM